MIDWADKKRGLIGTPSYPSRANSLSFNAGQREALGVLSQTQSFEGSIRIKRFGIYEQIFNSEVTNISTTNCCNVSEIVSTPMKCGTTQQLGILTDYNQMGIASACTTTRYRWTLELAPGGRSSENGIGNIDVTIITNPVYTAPACEQEEESPVLQTTVRISLFCNDVLANYVDIEIRTTICCPKKIVYETLEMFCGESQTLSPDDFSLDCDPSIYEWEIIGAGFFDDAGTADYTRTYNAPACGAGCTTEATINLYCDDQMHTQPVDSIKITIYPCPKNASITYTTQQMSVNELQTLGIDKYDGGCGDTATWSWEILSGGGTLSDPTSSISCVYTAPATNANCENNPTISLSCDGVVMDTLDIAINAVTSSPSVEAYYTIGAEAGPGACWWGIKLRKYNCEDGEISNSSCFGCHCDTCTTGICCCGFHTIYDPPGDCAYSLDCDAGSLMCTEAGIVEYHLLHPSCGAGIADQSIGTHDVRTDAQKLAGCCPRELL